jgi:glyoxylase-like metal-dependent hydrolase (beta-lactamase superfamily II)
MHFSPLALKSCICAAVFMLFTALEASAAMPAGDPFELEWRELAPGVWWGIRPMSWRQPVVGSTVVVIGKTGVLVYDPAGFALQGERLVRKVAELTELPITHLAVSHWHDDHHLGVYKVLEEFPKAELIAQEFTARAVASPLMGDIDGPSDEELKAQRESMQKALETGKRSDGTPVTESAREYYADVLRYGESVVADMRRAKVSVPTATVKDRRIVDLGGRQAELRHIAPGNTKGDLFLWLPEERILATGDIVVRPTPYGFGSYPRTWAGVLRDLKALDPRISRARPRRYPHGHCVPRPARRDHGPRREAGRPAGGGGQGPRGDPRRIRLVAGGGAVSRGAMPCGPASSSSGSRRRSSKPNTMRQPAKGNESLDLPEG